MKKIHQKCVLNAFFGKILGSILVNCSSIRVISGEGTEEKLKERDWKPVPVGGDPDSNYTHHFEKT
ncbi:TPA: hypothetical protein VAK94_002512 [Citrobacter freundii]|nr:hypothetical protein [Citrobacter freundii]